MKKKLGTWLLLVVLLVGSFPTVSLAAGEDDTTTPEVTTETQVTEPQNVGGEDNSTNEEGLTQEGTENEGDSDSNKDTDVNVEDNTDTETEPSEDKEGLQSRVENEMLEKEIKAEPPVGISVFRVYNANSGLHHYTTSSAEVNKLLLAGWKYEGEKFGVYSAPVEGVNTSKVYRVYNKNDGNHHWTLNEDEYKKLVKVGWKDEGLAWYAPSDVNTTPLYRAYNPNNGEHLYTMDKNEVAKIVKVGWKDEGTAWYTVKYESRANEIEIPGTSVFRLYNPNSGLHHYTTIVKEANNLTKNGWKFEGESFGVPDTGVDVYRVYNKNDGNHHWTKSKEEHDKLVKAGWKSEGVAWKSGTPGENVYRAYNPKNGEHLYTRSANEIKVAVSNGWKDEGVAWLSVKFVSRASQILSYEQQKKARLFDRLAKLVPDEDLFGCYRWVINNVRYQRTDPIPDYTGWDVDYANDILNNFDGQNYRGNCWRYAALFGNMAQRLGYKVTFHVGYCNSYTGGLTPHGWVEIDGLVYDPDMEDSNPYKSYFGKTREDIGIGYTGDVVY
jgi:hypothetical protein